MRTQATLIDREGIAGHQNTWFDRLRLSGFLRSTRRTSERPSEIILHLELDSRAGSERPADF